MQTSTTPQAVQQTGVKVKISGRLSYPDIFKSRPGLPDNTGKVGDPRFGCHIIFEPTSESKTIVATAIMQAAQLKWGAAAGNIIGAMEASKKCARNGNTNLDKSGNPRNGYAGMLYVVARSKHAPLVLADKFANGKPVHLREDGSTWQDGKPCPVQWKINVPYGGCYINAQIEIYAMEGTGAKAQMGKSINATLLAVQFLKDGEAFGGSRADESDFSQVGGDPEMAGSPDDPFGADPFAQPATATQGARVVDAFGM